MLPRRLQDATQHQVVLVGSGELISSRSEYRSQLRKKGDQLRQVGLGGFADRGFGHGEII